MASYAMRSAAAASLVAAALLPVCLAALAAELRGHGGAVRAIAVTPDGKTAITGSFDSRAILWSADTGEARQILLYHNGEVNAVATLPGGRFATGGADGRIAIWQLGKDGPTRTFEGHSGPLAALAVSPDGSTLASAAWDASVRLWPLMGGEPRVLRQHSGNVNALTFLADGTVVSAGYDANLFYWAPDPTAPPLRVAMPAPLNTLVRLSGDRVAVGGADGKLRVLDRRGTIQYEAQLSRRPLMALAASLDGRHLAAASLDDAVILLDATTLMPVRELDSAGHPVWSLAFAGGGKTLLAGSADHVVREWDVETGERQGVEIGGGADPMAKFAGNPDAAAFRACIACHTLDPDDGVRAGPTLHGIFGRRIASVPGYSYSPAFRKMDIVWTAETISKLFELGPNTYTPGTKMPEQTISDPELRAALIRFLQAETRND